MFLLPLFKEQAPGAAPSAKVPLNTRRGCTLCSCKGRCNWLAAPRALHATGTCTKRNSGCSAPGPPRRGDLRQQEHKASAPQGRELFPWSSRLPPASCTPWLSGCQGAAAPGGSSYRRYAASPPRPTWPCFSQCVVARATQRHARISDQPVSDQLCPP